MKILICGFHKVVGAQSLLLWSSGVKTAVLRQNYQQQFRLRIQWNNILQENRSHACSHLLVCVHGNISNMNLAAVHHRAVFILDYPYVSANVYYYYYGNTGSNGNAVKGPKDLYTVHRT